MAAILGEMMVLLATSVGNNAVPPAEAPRLDPATAVADGGLLWYDAQALDVEGRGWGDTEQPYDRLPARAKGTVREQLWQLSKHSAGIAVRFVTDAEEISARWALRSEPMPLEYMAASGSSGLDLYARDGDRWRWAGLARPKTAGENTARMLVGIPSVAHEYLLYLPLFNGVESVRIGVKPGTTVSKAPPRVDARPLVFYGTSITHGVAASRPGMSYPAILGRRLGRSFISLGFASNGTMDPELADLMAELDAAAYVVNCLPNMDATQVAARTRPFVERLRKSRPDTPILLVEHVEQSNAWLLPPLERGIQANNAALRAAYDGLTAAGVAKVYYVPNPELFGHDSEAAVDGIHPSDLGFTRIADTLEPVLRRVLTDKP
ncbi:MAG: SGNH/GDSL hydrolase family protein [Candidatus Hydrogenedentes bacterium]|nr:SGNH/GDSL hydrolase family protein [Candidatus Hydrogenedentota bacterium]